MRLRYEGALFDFQMSDQLQRIYARSALKSKIGWLLGKPYRCDDYLALCYKELEGKTHPVVIDVGCNIGTTLLPLAKKYPQGTFVAVDAHPVALGGLIKTIRLNEVSNVKVIAAAVSDVPGAVRIYTEPNNSGGNRITGFAGRADIECVKMYDDITVPTIDLKSGLESVGVDRADVMKIDVEGFECGVLRSLGSMLTPSRFPIVVAEYGPEGMRAAGATGWDMVSLMKAKGYRCVDLHTHTEIVHEGDVPRLADYTTTDFLFRSVG